MSVGAILVALGFALVFAVGFGVAVERAKAAAVQPYLEQMHRALAPRRQTAYTTRYVLEDGEVVWTKMGWTPGQEAGETISLRGNGYEVVEVREPPLGVEGDGECVVVLRLLDGPGG